MDEFQVREIAKKEVDKLGCQISCLIVLGAALFLFVFISLAVIEPDIAKLTLEEFWSGLPFK